MGKSGEVIYLQCEEWRKKIEMYILNANSINFVVDVETLDVFTISLNYIDKVVHSIVITENHLCIVDAVLDG